MEDLRIEKEKRKVKGKWRATFVKWTDVLTQIELGGPNCEKP